MTFFWGGLRASAWASGGFCGGSSTRGKRLGGRAILSLATLAQDDDQGPAFAQDGDRGPALAQDDAWDR